MHVDNFYWDKPKSVFKVGDLVRFSPSSFLKNYGIGLVLEVPQDLGDSCKIFWSGLNKKDYYFKRDLKKIS